MALICPFVIRRAGLSIGVPGIVDRSTGDVINCFNAFGHNNQRVDLKRELECLTGRTTTIDKDLNLAVLGEYWIGSGPSLITRSIGAFSGLQAKVDI